MAHHALLDTCVWLNLITEPDSDLILERIGELLATKNFHLIVPEVVDEEFNRHKQSYLERKVSSMRTHIVAVSGIVKTFGDDTQKSEMVSRLDALSTRVNNLETVFKSKLERIERIRNHRNNNRLKATTDALAAAALRGYQKRKPFRGDANSTADAIILETFLEFVDSHKSGNKCSFSFITDNKHDFSGTDERKPDPQLGGAFSDQRVRYSINIADEINWIVQNLPLPNGRPLPASTVSVVESWPTYSTCPNCSGTLVEAGLRGGMWYQRCFKCGLMVPTEEYVD